MYAYQIYSMVGITYLLHKHIKNSAYNGLLWCLPLYFVALRPTLLHVQSKAKLGWRRNMCLKNYIEALSNQG